MIPLVATSMSVQGLQIEGGSPGNWRIGDAFTARVTAVSDVGLARLQVGDAAVSVRVPAALKPGATVQLIVRHMTERGLLLELKLPGAGPGSAASAPANARPAAASLLFDTLRTVQGAIDAMLLSLPGAAQTAAAAGPGRIQARTAPHAVALRGDGDETGEPAQRLAGPPSPHPAQSPAARDGGALASRAGPLPPAPDAASVAAAGRETTITLVLPGVPGRFEIHISKDETHDRRTESYEDGGRTVSAQFSIASDAFGALHAILRQTGAAISIGLWAETPATAETLRQARAELTEEMRGAALALEAIDIFTGQPPVALPP